MVFGSCFKTRLAIVVVPLALSVAAPALAWADEEPCKTKALAPVPYSPCKTPVVCECR